MRHRNALDAIQSRLTAQQRSQQVRRGDHTNVRLQAPTPNTVSRTHDAALQPPIYELTDLYYDNTGDAVVLTAGEDSLSRSAAERRNALLAEAESFSTTNHLDWSALEEHSTITNVGEAISNMGMCFTLVLSIFPAHLSL